MTRIPGCRFRTTRPGAEHTRISHTVTFLPNTLSCSPNFDGWNVPAANAVSVPLLAGFETHVGQACLP
jgi:hypothetical protein